MPRASHFKIFNKYFLSRFLTKESLILRALKQNISDEIRQSSGIKPINIFRRFLPHQENFSWKVSSKIIYNFYLKHKKTPSAHRSSPLYLKLSPIINT